MVMAEPGRQIQEMIQQFITAIAFKKQQNTIEIYYYSTHNEPSPTKS
jgi:hypothetical protein